VCFVFEVMLLFECKVVYDVVVVEGLVIEFEGVELNWYVVVLFF